MDNTAFITKWSIIGNDKTLILPLIKSGSYDFEVDWGDGTSIEHITSHKASHTYPSQGIYRVSITGIIVEWRATDKIGYKLLDVSQWGCLELGNNGHYFHNCTEMDISATDAPDLSETTYLTGMFLNCYKMDGKIGHWDVSSVTNMEHMFHCASSFNQDISSWNVSSVTNMEHMFHNATSFNQPIGSWDVSNVKYMRYMFYTAVSFNQNIGKWDVSSVSSMESMFYRAFSFNKDISHWNVSNVKIMTWMFRYASSFNQDISKWDVSNVTGMVYMLADATAFIKGPYLRKLENWNVSRPDLLDDLLDYGKPFLRCYLISWDEWVKRHSTKISTEYTCSICLTDLSIDDTWRAISCPATMTDGIPHCFHKECIEEWFKVKTDDVNKCPVCRRPAIGIK